MFRHGETSCTGQPALPAEMVGVALSFLDGRSLTSFEVASRGTKLAMQGHPNLFKTLVTNQMANVPQMAPLSSKEGKRALIAWDGGDFQPLQARQDRVAPSPRYLHRVALATDGWHYLFGGHRQLDVVGDVWRFRVESRQGRSTKGGFASVSVRWEHVDGGASVGDGGSDSDGNDGSGRSATESESDSDSEEEEEADEGNPEVDGAVLPPVVVDPQPLPVVVEVVAAGVPGMGVPEIQDLFFQAAPLPADFDATGKPTRPRPRCAASWVCVPGSNKIYLYGGHGSGNDFLDDLWCFHAGGRGECRWEKLEAEGELRPRDSEGQEEGGGANVGRFPVPDGRWGHTMVEHKGALYMFGGSSPGKAYAGLWRLDTSVSPCVWSLLKPEGEQPPARGGHSATAVGDTLYIFGGNIVTEVFNDLWAVGLPSGSAWREIPNSSNFPLPRIGHSAVALGNRILIYGGRNFITDTYIPGLSCFDTDLQTFVGFPRSEAFSKRATRRGGMWPNLATTGHAAVPFSRGLLVVGGMVPQDRSTMTPWVLDVVRGRRGVREESQRSSRILPATMGCATS